MSSKSMDKGRSVSQRRTSQARRGASPPLCHAALETRPQRIPQRLPHANLNLCMATFQMSQSFSLQVRALGACFACVSSRSVSDSLGLAFPSASIDCASRVGVRFLEGLKLLRFYTEFSAAPNFYAFSPFFAPRAARASLSYFWQVLPPCIRHSSTTSRRAAPRSLPVHTSVARSHTAGLPRQRLRRLLCAHTNANRRNTLLRRTRRCKQ